MFKFVVVFAIVACAFAAPKPGLLAAAPLLHSAQYVHAAPVAALPVATSYHHQTHVSYKSPIVAAVAQPVVATYSAPLIKTAPILPAAHLTYAAPATYYH